MSVLVQIYLAIGVVVAITLVAALAEGASTPLGRPGGRGDGPSRSAPRSRAPHHDDARTVDRPAVSGGASIGRGRVPSAPARAAERPPGVAGTAWMAEAACREVAPEPFFSSDRAAVRIALRVCARCDVRAACLGYALDHGLEHGTWGGATERERRRMRTAPRRAVTVEHLARRTIEWWFPLTRR